MLRILTQYGAAEDDIPTAHGQAAAKISEGANDAAGAYFDLAFDDGVGPDLHIGGKHRLRRNKGGRMDALCIQACHVDPLCPEISPGCCRNLRSGSGLLTLPLNYKYDISANRCSG